MNNLTKSQHDEKIDSIAQELEDNGYIVLIEPSDSNLPFYLGGYHPNVIATKNDDGIILEVKSSLKRVSIDRFQTVAETIASHPGWRFLLVTLDDSSENILLPDENSLPFWEALNSRLLNLQMLIQESLFEPAILFFGSITEAALRKRAITQHLPIQRFPTIALLNHSYSSGEISMTEFDLLKDCLKIQEKVTHGVMTPIDPEILKLAKSTIQSLIKEWSTDSF
jgi:hypothetical protein